MAKRTVKLDMTNVESYVRCPEGEWLAKVKKADLGTVQGSGDDCIKVVFEVITKGEANGAQVFETFSLSEKALWKLKNFLEAIGLKASGKINLDLDKILGKTCIIDVFHDEYNGQKRAKVSDYLKTPVTDSDDDEEEEDEDEEEEEKPVKKTNKKSEKAPKKESKSSSKSKKKPEPEEDDDDFEEID